MNYTKKCKSCKGIGSINKKQCKDCEGSGIILHGILEENFDNYTEFTGEKIYNDELNYIELNDE